MKKFLFYFFPALFLFLSAAVFGYRSAQSGAPEEPPVQTLTQVEEIFTESPSKYKISSHKGYVALFEMKEGKEILLETYETPLSSLRERDADLLSKGIIFHSQAEADETLENFIN